MIFTNHTHEEDLDLFEELSLKPFKNLEHAKEYFVGEVLREDGSTIKVWVISFPAQFWRFEIFIIGNKKTTFLRTGSGSLIDFWPTIQNMLDGMIVVDKIV